LDEVTVIKQHPSGEVAWQYQGQVLERTQHSLTLQAFFNRDDLPFFGITLARGDRFIETFFFDRWYNIFEIHDRLDDRIKGWYCNVAMPATLLDGKVTYIDLALDLLVFPDGKRLILDEDEFDRLEISDEVRKRAQAGLAELFQLQFSPFLKSSHTPTAREG